MVVDHRNDGGFMLSRYAHLIACDGDVSLLYSAATTALARIPRNFAELLQSCPNRAIPIEIAGDERLGEPLKKNGFIVPSECDELKNALMPLLQSQPPSPWLGITIAPTMACNFNCAYCFEDKSSVRMMTTDTTNKVVSFIASHLEGVKQLSLTWYGGEPTLGIKRIEQITQRLAPVLVVHPAAVFTEIITNGYNLDAGMRARLAACGVNRYQVTLDGPRLIHDRRRRLKDGGATFDVIVDNIRAVMQTAKVDIRVNIDTENVSALDKIVDALQQEGLLAHCWPAFSHVDAITDASAGYAARCLAMRDFSEAVSGVYERCSKALGVAPLPAAPHVCGAVHKNSFVIDPEGRLYRCWTVIGDERECIGTVHDPSALDFADSFSKFNVTTDECCRACDILPICLGGCPYKFLRSEGEERCVKWKFNLYQSLRQYSVATPKCRC